MQQNLRFPAQCTVIPAEELEQISGGAPAWVGALKDQIRPYWQKAKPYLAFGIGSKPTIRRLVRIPPSMPTGRPMAAARKWWRKKR